MDTTQPSQTKPGLVLLTNAWGPKYGGINSFNMDFAKALGLLLRETHRVICVVLDAEDAEREDARKKYVQLLSVGRSEHHGHFEASRAHDVVAAVRREVPGVPILWWIGHDTITGDLALALPNAAGEGQSALINHMSYQDYVSYKHGVGETARRKSETQRQVFSQADRVFAVGPLLRDRLADLLEREPQSIQMLVPGLADIESSLQPKQLTGITFGRLDPENDRVKQGWLAAAAFASAYREARQSALKVQAYQNPPLLHVIGLAASGGDEENSLHGFVQGKAGRVLTLIPVPYDDNRDRVFNQLRRSSLAMMLSWHEGFGLTGWEAIAAAVPLIISQNSGVYQMIDESLGGSGIGCLHAVEVGGQIGDETGQNFRDEDEVAARNAILKIASNPERAKKDAARLREQLVQDGFTWQGTARAFVKALGIVADEIPLEIKAIPPQSVESGSVGPESKPAPTPAGLTSVSAELLELRPPSTSMVESFATSYLLRAEEECVPFHNQRQPLLQELLDWACNPSASPVALQLRIGPGGSGKTRLLRKVCSELAAQGWRAGFLRMDAARDVRRAMEQLVRSESKSLVVVDYAEGRVGEVLDVVEAALKAPSKHLVRIVLLARDAGDWWQRLPNERKSLEPFLSGRSVYGPYRMPPLQSDGQAREQIFQEAVSAFGSRLGRSTDAIVCPDLSAPHFGDLIYIHLSALSAMTGEQPETAAGLLDAVLNHELRYWRQASLPLGIDRGEDRLSQAMLVFTLCNGARTRKEATSLLKRIPRLRELTGDQRGRVIDVLRGFYPIGSGVDALRPDVLGEKLVTRELLRDDEPLDCLLGSDSDDKTREAALTVLTRLTARQPDQTQWLKTALERHLVNVSRTAVNVSVAFGQPFGNLFAEVLASAPREQQLKVVERVEPLLPEKSEALAEVALFTANQKLERLKAKGAAKNDKQRRALMMAYRSLAYWLDTLGRWEEALLVAQEDERLAANLVSAKTAESLSEHASALSNLGVSLGKLGRTDEALERSQSALAIRRRLAAQRPDAYRADLATSLSNTANRLSNMGQYEEALKLAREALQIRRELAEQRPDAYRADLAASLSNTASHLSGVGEYEEGLKLSRQALQIRRELAEQRPDAYRADLAESLSNTASHLSDVGEHEEGLKLSRQALQIRQELAEQRPDAYRADLAVNLAVFGHILCERKELSEAQSRIEEAREILRKRMTTHGEPPIRDQLAFASGIETKILVGLGDVDRASEVAMEGLGYLEKDLQLRPRQFPPKQSEIVRAMLDVVVRPEPQFPLAWESVQPKPTVTSASMKS